MSASQLLPVLVVLAVVCLSASGMHTAWPDRPLNFNNTCLIQPFAVPDGPRDFDCCDFVVRTTDLVWHGSLDLADWALEEYFVPDFTSYQQTSRVVQGLDALKTNVRAVRTAFPDLKIHIRDCFCAGNDVDGYKTTMPDLLTGTNTGETWWGGPPTNRTVTYAGLANTFVKLVDGKWMYVAEWVLHDESSFWGQLGVTVPADPLVTRNVSDCAPNSPSWVPHAADEKHESRGTALLDKLQSWFSRARGMYTN